MFEVTLDLFYYFFNRCSKSTFCNVSTVEETCILIVVSEISSPFIFQQKKKFAFPKYKTRSRRMRTNVRAHFSK